MKRYARGSHPYHQYRDRRALSLPAKNRRWPWFLLSLPLLALIIGGILYARPLPSIAPQEKVLALAVTKQPKIDWPSDSQAAFGTVEQGMLESKPNQTVRPTASTIKLLTVLTILDAKPLQLGEQGPLVPITQADVDIYNNYYSKNGSSVPVTAGERISEYQMLEGILLPSANNYADSLAVWAYGSLDKYHQAAQAKAVSIGMKHTTIGTDASGFSPTTTSTSTDLTLLGMAAIKHPLVAKIVQMTEVNLPVAGLKRNTNWLLGDDGVVGIKTGNINEVGGVFIFAYNHQLDKNHTTTIVGTIQGERTVFEAVLKARLFIKQIKTYFKVATPIKKDQVLATYSSPWGPKVTAVAKNDISYVLWPGKSEKPIVVLGNMASSTPSGSSVGTVKLGNELSPIITQNQLATPSWQWRVFGQ